MFNGYDSEEEYLESLKQEDSYHFSIDFEYIEKNYGNDQYDIGTSTMEVDVNWDEDNAGYTATYSCPDIDEIHQSEGNGDIEEIYTHLIEPEVFDRLDDLGISSEVFPV